MPPTLSIVTINYNNKEGLARTYSSVAKVLGENIEHITIDGASIDGSVQVMEDFLKRTSKAKGISEPDQGIYNAMNKGWRIATGRYIAYINSGDEIVPEAYIKFIEFLETRNEEVCYARTLIRNEEGTREWIHEKHPSDFARSTLPHPASAVLHSTLANQHGFDERYKIAGDRELFLRLDSLGAKFAFFPAVISIFYEGGLSSARETRIEDLYISRKYGHINFARFHIKRILLRIQKFARGIAQ